MWHSNRILSLATLILASMVAPDKPFSYAGLDRSITVEEVRARYPTSSTSGGGYFRISDEDSHDHIHAITASKDGTAIALHFGHEVPGSEPRRVDYESCEHVVSTITRDYGDPTKVADGNEEKMLTRLFTWLQPGEAMSVYCFYSRRSGRYRAEWLRIEPRAPGVQ